MSNEFTGVKVFSATKAREREMLGETVTDWLRVNAVTVVDKIVTQSSDSEFHCITITIFYRFDEPKEKRTIDDVSRDTWVDEKPKPAPKRLNFSNGSRS